jgi:hypothetical protein
MLAGDRTVQVVVPMVRAVARTVRVAVAPAVTLRMEAAAEAGGAIITSDITVSIIITAGEATAAPAVVMVAVLEEAQAAGTRDHIAIRDIITESVFTITPVAVRTAAMVRAVARTAAR